MDWVPVPRAHSAGLTISPCRVRVAAGPYNDMFVFPFVYAIQRATFSIWPRRSRLLDTSGAGQVLATLRNIKKTSVRVKTVRYFNRGHTFPRFLWNLMFNLEPPIRPCLIIDTIK